MTSCRGCKDCPDNFCYICGKFILKLELQTIIGFVKKSLPVYSDNCIVDQDKAWKLHKICNIFQTNLCEWSTGKGSMVFGALMAWREPPNHAKGCFSV